MSWRSPGFWIAALSLIGVMGLVVVDVDRASPGAVAAVHQRHSDLDGGNNCSECHGGWFTTMTDACLACHEVITAQREAKLGLHGSFEQVLYDQCVRCHSDHHGTDFALVNRQSFALAGTPDPEQFDHADIGFAMAGRHLEVECSKCHEHADTAVLPEGAHRYLGLDKTCTSCHEDSHEGSMQLDCTTCHTQEDFARPSHGAHERHLSLIGGHAESGCRDCHQKGTAYDLGRYGGRAAPPARQCGACHESPHSSALTRGIAANAEQTPDATCSSCHAVAHAGFRDVQVTMTADQHALVGFPLAKPHDAVSCEKCHAADSEPFAARYPGREADACHGCHSDPHAGQFADSPFARNGCLGCHDRQHFEPHAFTLDDHARTGLELTGRHRETDCHSCHRIPDDAKVRMFRTTSSACQGCHADAHRGFFDERADQRPAIQHGKCAHCHTPTSFTELPAQGFEHESWTGIAIAGAHAQAACESCHPRGAEPDATARTFGRATEHFGEINGCGTCHHDPHRGEFDAESLPAEVDGRQSCARCHGETSFRSLPAAFDHGRWTGFALEGHHRAIECSRCHPPLQQPDPHGRTWEKAKGARCADCHVDRHASQFERAGETDCHRCHKNFDDFTTITFRHGLDSRFQLGPQHAPLACSACHHPENNGELEFIRYRPLPRDCVKCHGTRDNPMRFRRRKR